MTGTLSYVDGEGYSVNADVKFTVHLGYVNADPDDYNTERNTHYTYTVTPAWRQRYSGGGDGGTQDDERETAPATRAICDIPRSQSGTTWMPTTTVY